LEGPPLPLGPWEGLTAHTEPFVVVQLAEILEDILGKALWQKKENFNSARMKNNMKFIINGHL